MRARKRKYLFIFIFLMVWFILLFSNIGHIVAGGTILASIIVIFLCGCISVNTKSNNTKPHKPLK